MVPDVRRLRREEIELAAGLVSRAFSNVPTSIACMGGDQASRMRFLHGGYRMIFSTAPELPFSAWINGDLVGILGLQRPGNCQLPLKQKARMAPFMIRSLSPLSVKRSLEVFATRDRHDAPYTHLHLEPLAVEPAVKNAQIGSSLCLAACDLGDELNLPIFGIIETKANVGFFESLGGELDEEFTNLGLPNWAVKRRPHIPPPERLTEQRYTKPQPLSHPTEP